MMMIPPERRVSEYLASRPDADVCDSCLMERTALAPAVIANQATILASTTLYRREKGTCIECGTGAVVTRAIPDSHGDTAA